MSTSSGGGGRGSGAPAKPKQTTLLQTWGYDQTMKSQTRETPVSTDSNIPEDDDDDALLLEAMNQSMAQYEQEEKARSSATEAAAAAMSVTSGFNPAAGDSWIYPTNYPVRQYQVDIVRSCLFDNTLVCLPTGLGKTFIAAVVMYNFYRWFPRGKIVFMAPTKPLVTQQMEACFNIMGIQQSEMREMTGNVVVANRKKAWNNDVARVIFLTPQVMANDLTRGLFPANQVKLLVVDEAHRAQGNYAYCLVVRELMRQSPSGNSADFRVLALSATPGTDVNAVKAVISNLIISKIELRHEESPDIVPYTHQRTIEKVVVPLGKELGMIRDKYNAVLEVFVRRLANKGALSRRGNSINPTHYTRYGLLQARNEFRQNPPANLDRGQCGSVEGDFASAISLYHASDLLLQHGMRTFFNFLLKTMGELASNNENQHVNKRLRYELNQMSVWAEIVSFMRDKFQKDATNDKLNASHLFLSQVAGGANNRLSSPTDDTFVLGHPKMEMLRDKVVAHFKQNAEKGGGAGTRVMIFSEYRDSVKEIATCLSAYQPLIKVMQFVGHGAGGNSSGSATSGQGGPDESVGAGQEKGSKRGKRGLTQKDQIAVVKKFREGGYNTLVSTCVGEEGLDIGEVDLIVCYDVSKSPIRLVQRMGRTGRKREGKIIVLVTEGKEEQIYNQSVYSRNSIKKAILDKNRFEKDLCKPEPIFPQSFSPVCQRMKMTVGTFKNEIANKNAGGATGGAGGVRKIQDAFQASTGRFQQTNGFLSDSEMVKWSQKWLVEGFQPKLVSKGVNLWNKSKKYLEDKVNYSLEKDNENVYSLGEWSMWYANADHGTGRLVSRSRATNTLMEITAKIHSGDSFCDNIVQDPLPEGSDIKIAVKIDVGHDAGAKEEDDVLSCLSLEDIVLLESCKPKAPSQGLDEYLKDIDDMPSAVLDLFDEEELGEEIDLTSRAPPDFEDFISRVTDEEIDSFILKRKERISAAILRPPRPTGISGTKRDTSDTVCDKILASDNGLKSEVKAKSLREEIESGATKCSTPVADTRRPNLPAVTPSACGLPNDSLFNSSALDRLGDSLFNSSALDRLGDSTLPEFPASLKKSRTSSVKVAAQPDLCSTPVIGSGIIRGQTPFEDKNDDSLFNSSALSRIEENNAAEAVSSPSKDTSDLQSDSDKVAQPKKSFDNSDKVAKPPVTLTSNQFHDLVNCTKKSPVSSTDLFATFDLELDDLSSGSSLENSPPPASPSLPATSEPSVRGTDPPKSLLDSPDPPRRPDSPIPDFEVLSPDKKGAVLKFETSCNSPEQLHRPLAFKMPDLLAYESRARTPKAQQAAALRAKKSEQEVQKSASPTLGSQTRRHEIRSPAPEVVDLLSQVQMPAGRKGGRKLALLESSSEDERSPAPNTRCSRSSSPGFSPGLEVLSQVQLPEAARGRKRTLVTDSSSEEEENGSVEKCEDESITRRRKKKKSGGGARRFLDLEAVRDSDTSADEDDDGGEDEDNYEASFVDDHDHTSGERSMYLKAAAADALHRDPKVRLVGRHCRYEDVFSQRPSEDSLMEDYGDDGDSFVVGNDDSNVEYRSSSDDLDGIEELSQTVVCNKKQKSNSKGASAGITSKRPKVGGRIKSRAQDSSSSSESDLLGSPPPVANARKTDNNQVVKSNTIAGREQIPQQVTTSAWKKKTIDTPSNITAPLQSTAAGTSGGVSSKSAQKSGVSSIGRGRLTVVACPSEILRSSEVLSLLKHDHQCDVVMVRGAVQHGTCFTVSPRTAVVRMTTDEFCNATNRGELINRCQALNQSFSRPFLIVECANGGTGVGKAGNSPKLKDCAVTEECESVSLASHALFGNTPRTKYVDGVLAALSDTNIRVLFSDSQPNSAHLIASLAEKESARKHSLPKVCDLPPTDSPDFKKSMAFYQSLPDVGMGVALQLTAGFKRPSDFANAARATIEARTNLNSAQVKSLQNFVRRDYSQVSMYE